MPEREKLTDLEISWIIEGILQSEPIDNVIKRCDFKSRNEFNQYLKTDAELLKAIEQAKIDSCIFIENDLLNIHKIASNHKMAKVMADAKIKVLAFINPQKYGNKIDLNLNAVVSIRGNLTSANDRVQSLLKDVTPAVLTEVLTLK